VADIIIHSNEVTFIGGRNNMKNILTLPLMKVCMKTKRGKIGIVLKLDFKKAYDKIHWGFLLKYLRARGFDKVWCSWIESVLHNGIMCDIMTKV
jgi:hypothetical protein